MKYLKKVSDFNKKSLIKENKQQALSILDKKGLDSNDVNFKEIKRIVNNNTSYLGLFTSFFFEQGASFDDLDKMIGFLRSDDSKKLNKNPLSYNFEDLTDEINEIISDKQVNHFYKELPTEQQNFVDINNSDFRNLAEQFFSIKNKKGFYKNISKIKDFESLLKDMEEYIEKYKKFGNYDSIIDVLSDNPKFYEIVLDDKENEIIIAKIKKYEGSKLVGSGNWCIVNHASHWTSYTSSTPRNQYFVWNFGLELSDPNYFTAYTIGMDGNYYAAFDFNNKNIERRIPKHVKDNKEYLKGPSKSDLDEIQLRKFEEEQARNRERRERELQRLRERQAVAEQHKEDGLFENDPKAISIKSYLEEWEDLEIDEDEDIYDVLFKEEYGHYRLDVFYNENDGSEWAVGDYDDANKSCYQSIENLLDDIGYSGFNLDIVDYIDEESLSERIFSWYEDMYREDWKEYGIEAEITYRGKNKADSIVSFLMELEDIDSDMEERIDSIPPFNRNELDKDEQLEYISDLEEILGDLEGNFTNEDDDILDELEEEREKFYELAQELQDEDDDDYWEMSEDNFESFQEDKIREISRDPIDYLKDFGYDEQMINDTIEDYIDKDKFIEEIISIDGFGNTLSSYDGSEEIHEHNGIDYYIFRIN